MLQGTGAENQGGNHVSHPKENARKVGSSIYFSSRVKDGS